MIRPSLLTFTLSLLTACGGGGSDSDGIPTTPPSAAAQALVLREDPGAAKSVTDARAAGAADAVVIEGRIREITPGFAAFRLIDEQLPYCGQECKDGCRTPWDYCCEQSDTISANLIPVEAVDASGKTIATPALPDLRNLDKVKVKGKLTVDERGNFKLLASGIYRVERPQLPGDLLWSH